MILWPGKIGWGDVISPICIAARLDEPLTFVWGRRGTPWARAAADFIAKNHEKPVEVHHVEGELVGQHSKATWDDSDPMHNVGFARAGMRWRQQERDDPDWIRFALTTPESNLEELPEHKQWKLGNVAWGSAARRLMEDGPGGVRRVDYRTPTEDAAYIIRHADVHVGYHGNASWLARWLGIPQIVVSSRKSQTQRSFPHAVVVSELGFAGTKYVRGLVDGAREKAVQWP